MPLYILPKIARLLLCIAIGLLMAIDLHADVKLDSLQKKLNTLSVNDSDRVNVLSELCYFTSFSDIAKAQRYGQEGLKLAYKQNYTHGIIKCLNDLASCYIYQVKYNKGQQLHQQAFRLAVKTGYRQDACFALMGMANMMASQRRNDQAIIYYNQALEYATNLGDSAQIFANQGYAYLLSEQVDKALIASKKALNGFKKLKRSFTLPVVLLNITQCYLYYDRNKEAESFLDSAYYFLNHSGDDYNRALYYSFKGQIAMARKKYADAMSLFDSSRHFAQISKALDRDINALIYQVDILESQKKFEAAFRLQKQLLTLQDSLNKSHNNEELNTLRANFDAELKEDKIRALSQENRIKSLQNQQQKNQIFFIYSAIAVLTLLIVLLFLFFRNEKKNVLTLGLANQRLQETAEALASANTAKNRLFSIIAHDLRGPMLALRSSADLVAHYAQADQKDKLLELAPKIKEASDRTCNLLDNLLNWVINEMGQIHFQPENVCILHIVSEAKALYAHSLEHKNQTLVTELTPEFEAFHSQVDKRMVQIILNNLVNNAVKFSPSHATIHIKGYLDNDRKGILAIQDRGIGMTEEQIAQIFSNKPVLSAGSSHSEAGTGLGLVLVKSFCDKNNIQLVVSSQPNKGTTFTLYFTPE